MHGQQKRQHSPSRLAALPGPLPRQDPTSFPACISGGSGGRASANSSGKLKVPSMEAAGAVGESGAGHLFCKESMSASTQPQQCSTGCCGSGGRGLMQTASRGTEKSNPPQLSGDEKSPVIYVPF